MTSDRAHSIVAGAVHILDGCNAMGAALVVLLHSLISALRVYSRFSSSSRRIFDISRLALAFRAAIRASEMAD